MNTRCARCAAPASSLLSYDYGTRRVWLEDVGVRPSGASHALCERHASRFTPPVAWSLADLRSATPTLPFDREVA